MLIPAKSKTWYSKEYSSFMSWMEDNDFGDISEVVLVKYFKKLSTDFAPSSLWTKYSMLKKTLLLNNCVDIAKFTKLNVYLKETSKGYVASKSKVLSSEDILKFLREAPNEEYLMMKVATVFTIFGGMRRRELVNMLVTDVEDRGNIVIVKINKTETDKERVFTITDEKEIDSLHLIRLYSSLRPRACSEKRFFLNYKDGYLTALPVGKNNFGKIPSMIAKYLGLPDAEKYTRHCMSRSFTGDNMAIQNRHDCWCGAQGYWDNSFAARNLVSCELAVVPSTSNDKQAGAKTEDITSCVSESLSSEDSNHSELLHSGDPLALEDDSRPGTSSSVDFASFPGTSGVNPLPSSSFATVEMPPPRLPPSRGASPALQSMSVTQSLPLPAQNRGGERETSSEERVTPGSVGNGLNDALLETNRLDDALQRLEGISDKVNGLSGAEDNFDNFGKYVASLLRSLPTSKVADVQQQVINLILSSHISPDAPSGDLNSSSSAGIAPSCSTSETLPTPKPPPPPPPPQTHSPAQSTPTSALQSNSKSTSQTKKGEKRPHAHDESPSGVGNKQVKLEDTEQIDATLKRLEEISDRVNQLGGRDDSFDVFGKYAASILRCLPPQRAMELQKEVVNLILREQGDSMTQTARRFHATATVAVS
ncbi:hypothetical protein C0J52_19446 [Blattella germanica]|nr:hypothetical protein C0J52_19446 [Blattella germanica]